MRAYRNQGRHRISLALASLPHPPFLSYHNFACANGKMIKSWNKFLGFWSSYVSCMAWRFCTQLFKETVCFDEQWMFGAWREGYVFWYKWYYWERIKILASAVLPLIHHLKRLPSHSPSPLNPHKLRHNMRQWNCTN